MNFVFNRDCQNPVQPLRSAKFFLEIKCIEHFKQNDFRVLWAINIAF